MFGLSTSRTIHACTAEIALLCALLWLGSPGDASAAVFDTINRIKSSGQLHVAKGLARILRKLPLNPGSTYIASLRKDGEAHVWAGPEGISKLGAVYRSPPTSS